jgi:hypothetical protein
MPQVRCQPCRNLRETRPTSPKHPRAKNEGGASSKPLSPGCHRKPASPRRRKPPPLGATVRPSENPWKIRHETSRSTRHGGLRRVGRDVQRHQRDRAAGHRVGYRSYLAGGERFLLPAGVEGRHGAGEVEDGVNLIARAKELGYTVAYNREELLALDPATTDRVLGVFAHNHTFNDQEGTATTWRACRPTIPRRRRWPR